MTAEPNTVYTIGHSNHEPAAFVALLRAHGVNVVVDVRSAPYSRYLPHFNKEALADALREDGIGYTFRGKELGGQPSDRALYDANGHVDYAKLAATGAFEQGIAYLLDTAAIQPEPVEGRTAASPARRAALMCSEKEPLDCHRTLLISQVLAGRGVGVAHIHADGSLEHHDDALNRLLDGFNLPHHGDLFRSRAEVIEDAVARRAQRVGARWRDPALRGDGERAP